jgi:hypothetical protein
MTPEAFWGDALEGEDEIALPGDERVLVAVMNAPRDWERVCVEHWYRIPVARAPKRLGAEYLAFYHTRRFPALRWTITYYAPIQRFHLAQRRELLPDEPDHPRANALYYKLELGELMPVPHPIPSDRLRRVSFIMTTLPRLLGASEVNDLWEKETAHARLGHVRSAHEDDA